MGEGGEKKWRTVGGNEGKLPFLCCLVFYDKAGYLVGPSEIGHKLSLTVLPQHPNLQEEI